MASASGAVRGAFATLSLVLAGAVAAGPACGGRSEEAVDASSAPSVATVAIDASDPSGASREPAPAPIQAAPDDPPGPRAGVRPLRLQERTGDPTGPIGYLVVEPDDAEPTTPVVIALHGMGDTAEAFARFVRKLRLRARVIVGRAPLPFGMAGGRQWFERGEDDKVMKQVHARAHDLVTLADKLRALYPEAGKPAIIGFSQGAVVVLQAALEAPGAWRAAVGLSGFIPSEGGATRPTTPLPILVVAGSKDDIIREDRSWAAAGALERAGHTDVRRFEFDGPHQIPREVIAKVREFFADVLGPDAVP